MKPINQNSRLSVMTENLYVRLVELTANQSIAKVEQSFNVRQAQADELRALAKVVASHRDELMDALGDGGELFLLLQTISSL